MSSPLQYAASAYQQGDLKSAGHLCADLLKKDPAYHPALNLLALIENRKGRTKVALRNIAKAIKQAPSEASYWNNQGEILRTVGEPNKAKQSYTKAITLQTDYPEAESNLGAVLAETDPIEAEKHLRRAVQLDPKRVNAWFNLAVLLANTQRHDEAASCYSNILKDHPNDPDTLINLASIRHEGNQDDLAKTLLEKVIKEEADNTQALHLLGQILTAQGHYQEATHALQKLVNIDPEFCPGWLSLSQTFSETAQHETALAVLQQAPAACHSQAQWLSSMSLAHFKQGHIDAGLSLLKQAEATSSDEATVYKKQGDAWLSLGEFEKSNAAYRSALKRQPNYVGVYAKLIRARKITEANDPDVLAIQTLLESGKLRIKHQITLNFALGKAFEDLGLSEQAFTYYQTGNDLQNDNGTFSIAPIEAFVDALIERFPSQPHPDQPPPSKGGAPIFVVGMPRSGTTLVEQILASHPQIQGSGELPNLNDAFMHRCGDKPRERCNQWLAQASELALSDIGQRYRQSTQRFSQGVTYFIDKMPHNFLHLGLIAQALPQAKIIHCQRDPMDTCFSIFKQNFEGAHGYAYNQTNIAHYYLQYQRLMEHWRNILGSHLYEISYESLVANQRQETAGLLDYLQLDPDEACIQFHKSSRTVHTASIAQVRQPIYNSSIQAWQTYAQQLSPMQNILKTRGE